MPIASLVSWQLLLEFVTQMSIGMIYRQRIYIRLIISNIVHTDVQT